MAKNIETIMIASRKSNVYTNVNVDVSLTVIKITIGVRILF